MGVIERVTGQIAAGVVPMRHKDVAAEAERLLRMEAPRRARGDASLVADMVLGLGPLEALMRNPAVTDILVNGPDEIWVEENGTLRREDLAFSSVEALHATVERVLAPLGLRVDRSSPFVDARLPDGSRLHAVVPPASLESPIVAIRRFTQAVSSLDELVRQKSATQTQIRTIADAVSARETIVVSGGTGTGKTTLLNLLGGLIGPEDRIVTIEDAAELAIPGHVVRLEAHPANAEGAGEVTIRSLLRSALRLRPDRIIVGEVRGPEAFDLVSALNTGHRGSLSTVHANSPEEAMWRLETLALSAGDGSESAIRRQLYAAIGMVIQLVREGPVRKVDSIVSIGSDVEEGLVDA